MNEAVSERRVKIAAVQVRAARFRLHLPDSIFSCGNVRISGVSRDISYGDSSYADIPACIHYSERL